MTSPATNVPSGAMRAARSPACSAAEPGSTLNTNTPSVCSTSTRRRLMRSSISMPSAGRM